MSLSCSAGIYWLFQKKFAFEVIDSGTFLTYIWRGIYKHTSNNTQRHINKDLCGEKMTIESLRARLEISDTNYSIASRISDSIAANLILSA